MPGPINSNISGYIDNSFYGASIPSGSGYGEVYGILWDGKYPSVGLSKHSLTIKNSPGTTGNIFNKQGLDISGAARIYVYNAGTQIANGVYYETFEISSPDKRFRNENGITYIDYDGVVNYCNLYSGSTPLYFINLNYKDLNGQQLEEDAGALPNPIAYCSLSGLVNLYFKINVFSGFNGGKVLSGSQLDNINYYKTSGYALPSGILMHKESYKLLPNYGNLTSDVLSEDGGLAYQIYRGGIYPSMLQDNLIEIYLQMTWSGASGDAENC